MTERSGVMGRDVATRKVMKTLSHSTAGLPFTLQDGTSPLVIAMPYEHVSEVLNRVRSMGGQANVAVAFATNYATLVIGPETDFSGNEMEINQDLSMGMFLIKVKSHPGQRVRFRFRDVDANVPEVRQELAYT